MTDQGNKYHKLCVGLDGTKTTVDVYRVLEAFDVRLSGIQHAIKKLLCAGTRGQKGQLQDLQEAVVSINRTIEFLEQVSQINNDSEK